MIYFVTAIGTDSGKTLVSAIITEALEADYWKPIQSGEPRDAMTVKSLISNPHSLIFEEKYLLKTPASPHASAKIDGVQIDLSQIVPPVSNKDLIIEGAGGIMVPINDHDYVIDIPRHLECQVVLVSNLYLGSINHTLLSIEYLKNLKIPVKGIIFNGPENQESQDIIMKNCPWPCLLHISQEKKVTHEMIRKYGQMLKKKWTA